MNFSAPIATPLKVEIIGRNNRFVLERLEFSSLVQALQFAKDIKAVGVTVWDRHGNAILRAGPEMKSPQP
jgi:hypothetical protein